MTTNKCAMIPADNTIKQGALEFKSAIKKEIEQLDAGQLPLQRGLLAGSHVQGDKFTAMILGVSEDKDFIHAKAGIFYNSIIAG